MESGKLPENPYKGLIYFRSGDRLLFSGRDGDIRNCVNHLLQQETRALILHGVTGCGKSSFLRAGLIPQLEDSRIPFQFLRSGDADNLPMLIRCGADPIARIAETVYLHTQVPFPVRRPNVEYVDVSTARLGCENIHDFIHRCRQPGVLIQSLRAFSDALKENLLLVLDQAEEVITLSGFGAAHFREFMRFVRDFVAISFPVKFIFALRKDYSGEFIELASIRSSISLDEELSDPVIQMRRDRDHLVKTNLKIYLLRELDKAQVLNAITLPTAEESVVDLDGLTPFKKYRFKYDRDVAETICNDLFETTTSALPIMQIVCRDLFNKVRPAKTDPASQISMQLYIDGGRVSGPVDRHVSKSLLDSFGDPVADMSLRARNVEEDRGRELLYQLVSRDPDGSVHSKQMSRATIRSLAEKLGLRIDLGKMLNHLSSDDVLLLRKSSILSASEDDDTQMFSLGHDTIGLVLHDWMQHRIAARETQKRVFKQVSIFGVLTLVAGMGYLLLQMEMKRAAALAENRVTFKVLVANARKILHQDPQLAVSVASNAVSVADKIREHGDSVSGDHDSEFLLADLLAGLPDKTIENQLASDNQRSRARSAFPLIASNAVIEITLDKARVTYLNAKSRPPIEFSLPDTDKDSPFIPGADSVGESASGDILLKRGGPFIGLIRPTVFILRVGTGEAERYGIEYFEQKVGIWRPSDTTPRPTSRGMLSISNSSVILNERSDTGEDRVFAFYLTDSTDSANAFRIASLPESLAVRDKNQPGVEPVVVLNDHVVVQTPTPPTDLTITSYRLRGNNSDKPKKFSLKAVRGFNDCKSSSEQVHACRWQRALSDPQQSLYVLSSSISKNESGDSETGSYQSGGGFGSIERLLFIDVETGKTLYLETEGLKDACEQFHPVKGRSSPQSNPVDAVSYSYWFYSGTTDKLLLGIVEENATTLVSVDNRDGEGVPGCLGTLHLTKPTFAWSGATTKGPIFSVGANSTMLWNSVDKIGPHKNELLLMQTAKAGSLVRAACASGAINEIAKDEWEYLTGLEKPQRNLCEDQRVLPSNVRTARP